MRSHIPTTLEYYNLTLSACFSSFPSSLFLYSLDSATEKKNNPVWSFRNRLFCMCPVFSFPDSFSYNQEASYTLARLYLVRASFKILQSFQGSPPIAKPSRPASGYKWRNLHHSRSIEIILLFAFLCIRKLGKVVQEMNNGRSTWTDRKKDYSYVHFVAF